MQTLRFKNTAVTPGGLINMSGYGPECDLDAGTWVPTVAVLWIQ